MRLLNVGLTNFLSYQDEQVDLSNVELAALIGPNGSGKSSLLDAITYCLYGEGRATDANDFIRKGTEDCRVEVTFVLNDETYRVIRARSSTGRGKTLLELQRRTAGGIYGEDWEALSGQTATETQKRITEVLRLDYKAFISSALILQGDADRFTAASAADRKQVLGEILDLSAYDTLEGLSRERSREAKALAESHRRRVEEIRADIDRYGDLETSLDEAKTALATSQADLTNTEADVAAARDAAVAAEREAAALTEVKTQADSLSSALGKLETERAEVGKRITGVYDALFPPQNPGNANRPGLAEQIVAIESRISGIRSQDAISADLTETRAERGEAAAAHEARQAVIDANAKGRQAYLDAKEAADAARKAIEERAQPSKDRLESAKAQAKMLPVQGCDSPTQGSGCFLLQAAFAAAADIPKLDAVLVPLREEHRAVKNPETFVAQQVPEAPPLAPIDARIRSLEAELATAQKAETQRDRLRSAQERIDAIDADLGEQRGNLAALQERLAGAAQLDKRLAEAKASVTTAEEAVRTARQAAETALVNITKLEGQIERRDAARASLTAATGQQEVATTLVNDWTLLTRALGRDGIPAMLVENALPQLEGIANDVLDQIATEPLRVRLASQKETKGGDLKETLDVIIEASDGPRPYELFSGGERFRVDFALRVGLAKLLAHRNGARVETLIVDEGLAPVDADGKAKFLECLHAIRNDFKTILVVTHHTDVQDAFPQHLFVSKDDTGSHVRVA